MAYNGRYKCVVSARMTPKKSLCHVMILFLFEIVSATPQNNELISIECCHIYASTMQFVSITTAESEEGFCPRDCKKDSMIAKITKNLYPLLEEGSDASTFTLNTTQLMNSEVLSNFLAWSVVGRLSAVEKFGKNHADYLQFDTGSKTLVLRRTGCEFQKVMYATLLGLTTIMLSFLIVSGLLSRPDGKGGVIAAAIGSPDVASPISFFDDHDTPRSLAHAHVFPVKSSFRYRPVMMNGNT